MSSTNNPFCRKILKNEMTQFKARVSLLTKSKLNEKLGKLNTEDKESEGIGLTVPEPRTRELEPSAKVT